MYHAFSVAETIKTAWNILKRNFVPLVVYSVISLVINQIFEFLKNFIIDNDNRTIEISFVLVQMMVQCFIGLSFYKLILTLMDRQYYEFDFKDILPTFKMTFNFFIIGLLTALFVAFLFFLYVLGQRNIGYESILQLIELLITLFVGLRCMFCICFIVDDDSSPIESLKQSFEITKDNFFKTAGIFVIILLILAAVLLPVVIIMELLGINTEKNEFASGLAFYCWFILCFPFTQVIIMVTYRKLVYSHLDVDDDLSETD